MKASSQLIPVHISKNEMVYLDDMQKQILGKKTIKDPNTGLKAYPALTEMIANPIIQKLFVGAIHAVKNNAAMPEDVKHQFNTTKAKIEQNATHRLPSEYNDFLIQQMEAFGGKEDKVLVMMPIEAVEFLDENEGTHKKESAIGLEEFGFFDGIFTFVDAALHKDQEHHFWGDIIGGGLSLLGGWLNKQAQDEAENENERKYQEELRDWHNRRKAYVDRWNANGLQVPILSPAPTNKMHQHGFVRKYKKGGFVLGKPILGKGKGQDDLIHVDVPQNTWIHNATFVSDLGDGSSDAGHKEIEGWEKFINKNILTPDLVKKFKTHIKENPPQNVPCALSNNEHKSPPLIVYGAGLGSQQRGVNILRDMVKVLRRHKISKGDKLPPPAPSMIDLYKKVAQKHLGGQV